MTKSTVASVAKTREEKSRSRAIAAILAARFQSRNERGYRLRERLGARWGYANGFASARGARQELEIAREVRLLPSQTSDYPRLDFGFFYQPAREVGGNYYE